MIKYEGFQVHLVSVLGSSWAVSGSIFGSKIIEFRWFYKGSVKNRVFEEDKAWKCILDGSWVDFDAKRGPKRLPNRTQNGAEMGSKKRSKIISVFDRS